MKRIIIRSIFMAAFAALTQSGEQALAQQFEFQVRHDHTIGSCTGDLIITADGLEYWTSKKEHARKLAYIDIKMLKLESPREIKVLTYESAGRLRLERDQIFKFKVLKGEVTKEVSDFLLARVIRPLATSFVQSEDKPAYEIPVRHRHTFGGDQGALKIFADRVMYQSNKPESSRYWRWSDIRSISRMGPYQFSITTYEPKFGGPTKTFNFDLKERMGDAEYDYLWSRINKPALPASPETKQ